MIPFPEDHSTTRQDRMMSGRKVHEAITGQSRHIAMAVFTV
jgi:hypothetical protein